MRVLSILVGIAYPFLAYALLTLVQPRVVILVIAGALITYALRKHKRWHLDPACRAGVLLPVVVVITVMAIINDGRFVLFIPAVTNFALFVVFAYNGCLVYVAVAVVLGGERVYRYWRFRIYEGSLLDSIFRRLFPPLPQLVITLEDSASGEHPPNAVPTHSRPS